MILFGIFTAIIGYLLYRWGTKKHGYFKTIGIPYKKPLFLLGTTGSIFWKRLSLAKWAKAEYDSLPDTPIFGMFDFLTPLYFIRDPEIAKHLAVKEFDHFEDHKGVLDENLDPLLGNALTALTGQKWRNMRATLSPAFTGSKMRQMFELVTECGEQMALHMVKETTDDRDKQIIEVKELFSRFTNDVIATCAFGIKVNSLHDKDNEFFKMGREIMNFSKGAMMFRFIIIRGFPWLAKMFKVRIVSDRITNFFRSIILDTMSVREQQNIIRPDMIQLMMQVKRGDLKQNKTKDDDEDETKTDGFATVKEFTIDGGSTSSTSTSTSTAVVGSSTVKQQKWSDDQLIAQCLLFFLAGFDTSSTLLTFAAYELAINTDVQTKLIKEIDEMTAAQQTKDEKISYNQIQSMKYLDMVISETLRRWPPAAFTDRLCTKDYEFDHAGLKFKIEKGLVIWIPINGYHMDEKYFPNPERFDPERFNADNIGNIQPGTFIPFGMGPRNCIGSRFALMEIKAVLFYLFKYFTIEPCEKTVIPIDSVIGPLNPVPADGVKLRFIPRVVETK